MSHIFGPVSSLRLGRSLGIDLLPPKICNLDCLYCELGKTLSPTCKRGEYVPTARIIGEIDAWLAGMTGEEWGKIDAVTVTGSGEPTLHSGIGRVLAHLKPVLPRPLVVLTNGTLLDRQDVRDELLPADIVIPSLDAAREESFRRINRPAAGLNLEDIIAGLAAFARSFSGELRLEVLLAQGINDSPADIDALALAVKRIQPGRLQVHTVSRPPAYPEALPLSSAKLRQIAARLEEVLPGRVDCVERPVPAAVRSLSGAADADGDQTLPKRLEELLRRRPSTLDDLVAGLGASRGSLESALRDLDARGRIATTGPAGEFYCLARVERKVIEKQPPGAAGAGTVAVSQNIVIEKKG